MELLDDHKTLFHTIRTYVFDMVSILEIFINKKDHFILWALVVCDDKGIREQYKLVEKHLHLESLRKQVDREIKLMQDVIAYGSRLKRSFG